MFIVFERKPNEIKLKQISVPFKEMQEAIDFIDTMKIGKYYKLCHPEIELLYSYVDTYGMID